MTRKTISTVETAKLIREALKVEFPGIKFSVTSKSYTGGSSIRVKWTDGPTTAQVDAVTDFYKGSTFDSMIDLKSYVDHTNEAGETIHYGADHVFTDRDLTADYLRPFCEYVAKNYGFRTSWGNKGDYITPEYEIIKEPSGSVWIKNLNTAYFGDSNFADVVFKIARAHESYDAFQAEIATEEQKRAAWAKEHEQEKKWDAALEEAAAANDPEPETVADVAPATADPLPFDEVEVGEIVPTSEIDPAQEKHTFPDDKHALRWYRPAVSWHEKPMISLPQDTIQTHYGEMTVEVYDGKTLSFRIKTPFRINGVLYAVTSGNMRFNPYNEDWRCILGLYRVQENGNLVQGDAGPTDKAYDAVYAALAPLLNTWLERNYELLPKAQRIAYANLIQRARNKLDGLVLEIQARQKWLDIVETEVRSSGYMASKDHDSLQNIYSGSEWRFD